MARMATVVHREQAPTPLRRRLAAPALVQRALLPLLLAVFVALGASYAVLTPLFEVSDELWHYPMVKTLADGHGLPVQDPAKPGPWRQEGSQPPLYYALMALATRWIDTSDMDSVRWINPHADNGVITPDGNNNIIVHTYREAWPWHGTVLAVRLIRLLSVLLGAGTVYFTFCLAREVRPDQDGLALAAAALTAFTPMFVFVSASVNNDNLAILLSSAALWRLARWLRRPARPPASDFALMGLLLGGAALSKVSALGLWALAGAVMLWAEARRLTNDHGGTWLSARRLITLAQRSVVPVVIVFGLAMAVTGWWFLRNYQLYGDWLGWNAFLATVGARPRPATVIQLWGERVGFAQAYWGLFGGVSVPMPAWTYWVLNSLAALAGIGLLLRAGQALLSRQVDWQQWSLWALAAGWAVLIFVGLLRWTSLTWASQGRLIFPAISALGVLGVHGLARLWRGLPWLAVAFMGVLTAAVPWVVIRPHYAPPPSLSTAQIEAIAHRIAGGEGESFGGELQLLGYDLAADSVQPGRALDVTLYWQSLVLMDRNWSIFVHVVDEDGVIVAQRDRYPGGGALATSLLLPGQTFADHFVILLPEAAYAPKSGRLVVGLYDLADGARLPLASGSDAYTLAPVTIAARPALNQPGVGTVPNPWRQNFANQIELTGYAMDRRRLRAGETLTLTLYWQALGPIPRNYSVFAHVRGEGETLWAGQDAWPQQGASPTSTWRMGHMIVDTYRLTLSESTPPGQHKVEVGLYDSETLVRLRAVADDGRPTDADYVFLSPIWVVGE